MCILHISDDTAIDDSVIENGKEISGNETINKVTNEITNGNTIGSTNNESNESTTIEVSDVVDVKLVVAEESKMESISENSVAEKQETKPMIITTVMAFPSIMHKDAFLIFRALCKLSMKGLHESDESGSLSDPIALQNK